MPYLVTCIGEPRRSPKTQWFVGKVMTWLFPCLVMFARKTKKVNNVPERLLVEIGSYKRRKIKEII